MSELTFVPFKQLDYPTGAYQNGSSTAIFNLAPVEGFGYVPFGSPNSTRLSSALDTAGRGGTSFLVGGVTYIYVGTTGRLYHFNEATSTLTNVSQGGGTPYATSSTDWGWSFTRWGDGVIATNYVDHVQFKSNLTNTTAFADCFTSSTKPKAKFMGLVKNQLFVAFTNEGGTAYPQRVRWGAVDNAASMDASPTTMADYQDLLDDFGDITGFVGGDYGVVFKERGVYKVSFVGPPLFYRFDLIASGVGTRAPGSVVEVQGSVYFWGANSIYRVLPDAAGVERVDEGMFKALMAGFVFAATTSGWPAAIGYDKTRPYLVHSVVDPGLGCIYWPFPAHSEIDIATDQKVILACSPREGRSTVATAIGGVGAQYPQLCVQGPYTGSELNVWAPSQETGAGGSSTMYAVDQAKCITKFNRSLTTAPRIVSGFISPSIGKRAVIGAVRPIFLSVGGIDATAQTTAINGVTVLEIGSNGIATAERTFTAASGGWFKGKSNAPFLAIATTFVQMSSGIDGAVPDAIPAVPVGWEVMFDEMDASTADA